jgi:Tol biopolymer transport system component
MHRSRAGKKLESSSCFDRGLSPARTICLTLALALTIAATGCGGNSTPSSLPTSGGCPTGANVNADILYTSMRAHDCSDAVQYTADSGSFNGTDLWLSRAHQGGDIALTNGVAVGRYAWSHSASKIAFDAETNGLTNLWSINADGSGMQQLTSYSLSSSLGYGGATDPQWSPDDSKIAYVYYSNAPVENIWVMNADGSAQTQITQLTQANSFSPAWTPDGHKIVYLSYRALNGTDAANTGANIWIMNADGSGTTPLTSVTISDYYFEFALSPDGSKIAFSSSRALDGSNNLGAASNIWIMNIDGSALTPLTTLVNAGSYNVAWSADSSRIGFVSQRALDGSDAVDASSIPFGYESAYNIWVMNNDGSNQHPLTNYNVAIGPGSEIIVPQLTWSKDGTTIAFVSQGALDGSDSISTFYDANLWVMSSSGGTLTPLTKFTVSGEKNGQTAMPFLNGTPAWQP